MRVWRMLGILAGLSVFPPALAQTTPPTATPPSNSEQTAPRNPDPQELERLRLDGNAALNKANFSAAEKAYRLGLEKAQALHDPRWTAQFLNNLGNVCYLQGQFDQALNFYTRALALREKLGREREVAGSLSNLGIVYDSLGQLDRALDFYHRALALQEKSGKPVDIATALNNLGVACERLGQWNRALDFYSRALTLFETRGDPQDIAGSLGNIGSVYEAQGHFRKARDFYKRALARRQQQRNPQETANALNNLGNVYYNLNEPGKALELLTRALALHEKLGNEQDTVINLDILGRVYQRLHRFDKAGQAFSQAVARYERLLAQVSEASQVGALQNTNPVNPYLRYAAFLVQQRRAARAVELLERSRGRGLALQARQNRADISAFFSPADAALRQQLQTELASASERWQEAQQRPIPTDAAERQQLLARQTQAKQRYRKAETDWTALEASLRLKYPRYRQMQGFAAPSAAQLDALARAHPDTLYIEFAVVDDRNSLLFARSPQQLRAFSLPVGDAYLRHLTTEWKRALVTGSAEEPALAQKIERAVLAPLETAGLLQPSRFPHLVVVTDGPLLDIPFAALIDSNGRRLIERFALSSAFSLGSLLWPQEKRQPTGTLLCAADPTGDGRKIISLASRGGGFAPLPAARQEVKNILSLFSDRQTAAYFGKETRRERIQQEMSQYALLHFATHGIADGTIGLRSGLLLADDRAEAGYSVLEAREVMSMKLAAQMAVLSACETAQGQRSGGDGLLGLAWAFQAAGCPSIVASQWEVNDEATGQLMLAFYKGLKVGKRKDEALRQAMLAVKREKSAPFYWAAFQVIGDTGSLDLPGAQTGKTKQRVSQ